MGREVRMVPANWVHPKAYDQLRDKTNYVPLHDGRGGRYDSDVADWNEGHAKWQAGLCEQYSDGEKWGPIDEKYRHWRYTDYAGPQPSPDDYMPDWPDDQRTYFMMYEDTSEGTPISPAFATPEELAQWLVDNNASAFADDTASYEAWLRIAKGGWAPSAMMMVGGPMQSGVEAMMELSTTHPHDGLAKGE